MPASASPTSTKKRVLDIEAALRWAYQSELPKRREDRAITGPVPAQVHPMWRAGVFGGRIDCWNRDPGFPLAMGDPSPDALRIEAAVEALDDSTLDILPYDVGQGLGDHVDLRHVISITRRDVRSWIVTYARNGKRPDLGGPAVCEAVRSENGKATVWRTVQVPCGEGPDGTPWFVAHDQVTVTKGDSRDHGTFCKLLWTRTNDDVAEDRTRYALWHAALGELAVILAPVLQAMTVTPSELPARPWIDPIPEAPVVRPNMRPARRVPVNTRRPVALRQLPRTNDPGRVLLPSQWPDRYRSDLIA